MSITTSARFNVDAVLAALPGGAAISILGDPSQASPKTVTFTGADDATGQAAVTTAAGQYVDRDANKATLQSRAQAALTANATFLALAAPTNAQTLVQVQLLTKESTALIRLALGLLESTTGT